MRGHYWGKSMTLEEVSLCVGAISLTDWACPWIAKASKRTSTQNSCFAFACKGTGGESWAFQIWLFLQGSVVVLVLGLGVFGFFFFAPSDSVHSGQVNGYLLPHKWEFQTAAWIWKYFCEDNVICLQLCQWEDFCSGSSPLCCLIYTEREEGRGQKEPTVSAFLLESEKQHRQRRIKGKYSSFSYWFLFSRWIWQSQLFGDHKFTGTCFVLCVILGLVSFNFRGLFWLQCLKPPTDHFCLSRD